jgi:methyl-accepting chemotaxis protein
MDSQKARVSMRGMMLDTDRDRMEANADGIKKRYEDVERLMAEFEKSIVGNKGRKEFDEAKALVTSYRPVWEEMVRLRLADRNEEALELMRSKALGTEKEIEAAIRKMIEIKISEAQERNDKTSAMAKTSFWETIVFSVIGVLLALILGVFFARMITRPIRQVVELAEKIADGDLTSEVVSSCSDETGQLARAMNAMTEQLNNILTTLTVNSNKVSKAAAALTSNSEKIASDTEEAASQAVAVSTASEEMAATSEHIAQNCIYAAEGVKAAGCSAGDGADVVQETISGMNRISEKVRESAATIDSLGQRSDEIGSIISTIEDIAEQTNLLALNAAIEAARAGEQGRGFAVVADEVRALAERTTKATKEIGAMIKGIQLETRAAVGSMENGVSEVEKGIEGAARSGDALKEIIEHINGVSSQVNQIALAAEEQAATTSEINNNINHITQVVHETARGAQETASAANELASLAVELRKLVGLFKLAA